MNSYLLSALLLLLSISCWGQATDSAKVKPPKMPAVRPKEISVHAKATLMSAVLPGAGQAYNKKYWKVPLVYAGAVGFGLAIRFNHNNYLDFRNALQISTDGNPYTQNEFPFDQYDTAGLRRGRDYYRRYRDFSIILSIAFYGLQIADALADAHLSTFDVSDDLALHPSLHVLPNGRAVPSLRASYQF